MVVRAGQYNGIKAAIKQWETFGLPPAAAAKSVSDFMQEVGIMRSLGRHENLVRMQHLLMLRTLMMAVHDGGTGCEI